MKSKTIIKTIVLASTIAIGLGSACADPIGGGRLALQRPVTSSKDAPQVGFDKNSVLLAGKRGKSSAFLNLFVRDAKPLSRSSATEEMLHRLKSDLSGGVPNSNTDSLLDVQDMLRADGDDPSGGGNGPGGGGDANSLLDTRDMLRADGDDPSGGGNGPGGGGGG